MKQEKWSWAKEGRIFINNELPAIFNTMRQLGVTPEDLHELFLKQSKE